MSENASVGRDFPVDMNWRFIYQSPNWHVRFHPPLTFGYYLCNLRKRLFSSIANTDIISSLSGEKSSGSNANGPTSSGACSSGDGQGSGSGGMHSSGVKRESGERAGSDVRQGAI